MGSSDKHHSSAESRNRAFRRRQKESNRDRRLRIEGHVPQTDYPGRDERRKGKSRERYRYTPESES